MKDQISSEALGIGGPLEKCVLLEKILNSLGTWENFKEISLAEAAQVHMKRRDAYQTAILAATLKESNTLLKKRHLFLVLTQVH